MAKLDVFTVIDDEPNMRMLARVKAAVGFLAVPLPLLLTAKLQLVKVIVRSLTCLTLVIVTGCVKDVPRNPSVTSATPVTISEARNTEELMFSVELEAAQVRVPIIVTLIIDSVMLVSALDTVKAGTAPQFHM